MMTRLILCRHSKPEPAETGKPDRERELTSRGRRDAEALGRKLADAGLTPDVVISSDSVRTRQTTELVCRAFSTAPDITFLPELYSSTAHAILDTAATYADQGRTILVVAHNPGTEEAVWQLTGREIHMGTSTAACFETAGQTAPANAPLSELRLTDVLKAE